MVCQGVYIQTVQFSHVQTLAAPGQVCVNFTQRLKHSEIQRLSLCFMSSQNIVCLIQCEIHLFRKSCWEFMALTQQRISQCIHTHCVLDCNALMLYLMLKSRQEVVTFYQQWHKNTIKQKHLVVSGRQQRGHNKVGYCASAAFILFRRLCQTVLVNPNAPVMKRVLLL